MNQQQKETIEIQKNLNASSQYLAIQQAVNDAVTEERKRLQGRFRQYLLSREREYQAEYVRALSVAQDHIQQGNLLFHRCRKSSVGRLALVLTLSTVNKRNGQCL
jgi:hypothetical protein